VARTLIAEVGAETGQAPAECCAPLAAPAMRPEEAEGAAVVFRALADPHRVRIVNLLANAERPLCVCDLTDELGLAQGTVSFHLKKLLTAGLIGRERRGTWAYYSLRQETLARLGEVFDPEGGRR
jgi:ArsR family transcriptional regulator, arsenate/arsenite/antimonite-responsive transcriptional repressor